MSERLYLEPLEPKSVQSLAEQIQEVSETKQGDYEINLNLAGSNPVQSPTNENNPNQNKYLLIGGGVAVVILLVLIVKMSR